MHITHGKYIMVYLTCEHLHKHVNNVDDICRVVEDNPEGENVVVKLIKRLPDDDQKAVVEDGQCYHKQPSTDNNRQ